MSPSDSHTFVSSLLGRSERVPTASGDVYDFIIVGGGNAGLVLANRLTENKNTSVVVIEAGDDLTLHPRIATPALFPTMIGSEADWNLQTEPQEGLDGRRISMPLGRALGGSSAINGQTFVPPSGASIDVWGELGNSDWDFNALAPYVRKCHTLHMPSDQALRNHFHLDYIDETVTATNGPIQVSFPTETSNPLPKAWIETMNGLGHHATGDPLSGAVTGAFSNASSIDAVSRQRSYAASAYLNPVKDRPNLTVITEAHVQKIHLTGAYPNVVATGIEYLKNSKISAVRATQEVILAAGALHSPKLLELSGIGGSKILTPLGIHTVIDNPNVGERLQDHPTVSLSFEVRDGVKTMDGMLRHELGEIQGSMKEYKANRTGPLAQSGVNSFAVLVLPPDGQKSNPTASGKPKAKRKKRKNKSKKPGNTESAEGKGKATDTTPITKEQEPEPTDHPPIPPKSPLRKSSTQSTTSPTPTPSSSLQITTTPAPPSLQTQSTPTCSFHAYAAQQSPSTNIPTTSIKPGNFYTIATTLLNPLSRGSSHIRTANAQDAPILNPAYLSHPSDLASLAQNMSYLATITTTAPLSDLLKQPPSNTSILNNPAELEKYIKEIAISCSSPSGTCAMLPEDKGGVVNERLVVYGTRNLRVVDSSIFPVAAWGGNLAALVYAVAERAAEFVWEDWDAGRGGWRGR